MKRNAAAILLLIVAVAFSALAFALGTALTEALDAWARLVR